jgi:DNA polymerase-1
MLDILRHDPSTPHGDMHVRTAAGITGLPLVEVTKAWRAQAKVVNYLTSYGGQAHKLVEGIERRVLEDPDSGLVVPSLAIAKQWLASHKKTYPQYWQWVSWTIIRTRQLGYSETAFGRPRFFPDINSHDAEKRAESERGAVNHAIQGTAADLMKMAMVRVAQDAWMQEHGYMVLQVHDEIVAIVHDEVDVEQYKERLSRYMECGQPFRPDVELVVDIAHGTNWRDVHK